MALDPFSWLMVAFLPCIWIFIGVMFLSRYWPRKTQRSIHAFRPRGAVNTALVFSEVRRTVSVETVNEEVSSHNVDRVSLSNTLHNVPQVIITQNSPTYEDTEDLKAHQTSGSFGSSWSGHSSLPSSVDSSCVGPQLSNGDSSSGGSIGSQSDLSGPQSLHSNDQVQRSSVTMGVRSGPRSDLSSFHSLHSNDQPQKGSVKMGVRSGPRSDLSSFHSLHSSDQPQKSGPRSDLSSLHSLHSNDQPHKRTPAVDAFTKDSGSSIMSQPYTLVSTVGATHSVSKPGTLISTEGATHSMSKLGTLVSTEGATHSMSKPGTLLSTEGATHSMSKPGTLVSTEGATHSMSKPGTLVSTEGATHTMSKPGTLVSTEGTTQGDGDLQVSSYLQVGRLLSDVENSSTMSSFHSLRSTESPQRRWFRPVHDEGTPSLPAIIPENASEAKKGKLRWHSL